MNTAALLKKNYKEISERVAAIIRQHHSFLVEKGIAVYGEPPTVEVWKLIWNKFINKADPMISIMEKDCVINIIGNNTIKSIKNI